MESIVTERGQWEQVVRKLQQSTDPRRGDFVISADTETLDYGYPDTKITGLSLGWYEGYKERGCYVPLNHAEDTPQLDVDLVMEDLQDIFSNPERTVIFHNAKYDIKVFDLYDVDVRSFLFDTMVATFLLDTTGCGSKKQKMFDNGRFSLAACVDYFFDYEMTELGDFCERVDKYPETDISGEHVYLTHEVSIEEMADYAIDDIIWPMKLRDLLMEKFSETQEERRLWKIYENIEEPFIRVLADMEQWGVEIDAGQLEEMRDRMAEELDAIYRGIYEAREGQDFSPVDETIVREAVQQYRDLEERYALGREHPDYPDHSEYEDSARDSGPVGKGWARNRIFENLGIKDHPLEEKIRDAFDKTAPMEDHLEQWPELAHKMFNINSDKDLNKVLFDEANLIPYGEKTKRGLWPTRKEFVKKWAKEHPVAENLNRLRLVSKLKSTYAEGILHRIDDDGRLRTRFWRIIRTGRLSSRDPNLQNQPKEDDYPIRRAFVPTGVVEADIDVYETDEHDDPTNIIVNGPEGGYHVIDGRVEGWWGDNPPWVMGVADYSQLEIRILAHFSQDETMLETLRRGIDIHGKTALMMFPDEIPQGTHPNDVKSQYPKKRDNVKPIEFGTIYGQGPAKLSKTLGIPKKREDAGPGETSAEELIERFIHEIYPGIGEWIEKQHRFVRSKGYVFTYLGRKRHIPLAFIPDTYENKKSIWRAQRIAQNSPIQGTAADVINTAMVNIREYCRENRALDVAQFLQPDTPVDHGQDFRAPLYGEWVRMLLQVHDELIFEFHPAIANWGMDKMVDLMENAITLDVPLPVDAALGVNWDWTKE